jgi:hypothetical protein
MDGTWIRIYDPETKEQCKKWRHCGSSRPEEFKTQSSSSKVVASVFWDKCGILLVDCLEKDAVITAKNYVALLDELNQRFVSIHRGKLSKEILFLQDSAAPHREQPSRQDTSLHFSTN